MCWRCNSAGRCKKCSCVKEGRACSNCLPSRRGSCCNSQLRAKPCARALPRRCARGVNYLRASAVSKRLGCLNGAKFHLMQTHRSLRSCAADSAKRRKGVAIIIKTLTCIARVDARSYTVRTRACALYIKSLVCLAQSPQPPHPPQPPQSPQRVCVCVCVCVDM